MTGEATEWAWKQHAGGPAELAALLLLARLLDTDGTQDPTTREIAEALGCEQKTARSILRRLRERGLVKWTTGAGQASNVYELPLAQQTRSEVTTTSLARQQPQQL